MDNSNITIETKNLIIKSISLDYKEDIFREFTKEITKYMFPKSPEKIEETIDFISESIDQNKKGEVVQLVVLDKNGDFLGCVGAHNTNTKTPELGVWIKKSAHGHGYGKEATIAVYEWLKKNCEFDYILYPADKDNLPSRRIPIFLDGKLFREYDEENLNGSMLHMMEYRIYK